MDRLPQLTPGRLVGAAVAGLLLLWGGCTSRPGAGGGETELSEAAAWLRDYLRLDTTGKPGNGAAAVEQLAAILATTGAEVERLDAGDGYPSLWAYLPPTTEGSAEETLLLLHHLDVVDADGLWRVPPFSGEIVDGELWGRGAIDSKSLGVAHLAAFVELARGAAHRHRGVAFMASADEERGGRLGVGRWIEERPALFASMTTVINEGGINRGYDGRLHWWGIEIAQKRPLWLEATGETKALIAGLRRLVDREYRWRVPREAAFTFGLMAPLYNEHWGSIFRDLEQFIRPTGPTVMLMPGMETFFLDSIQTNLLELLDHGRARARIDVRLLPDTDQAALLSEIEALLGAEVETTVLLSSAPVEASPWTGPWIDILNQELAPLAPIVPQMAAGTTDSRYFRQRGVAAYGFSPFILNSEFTRNVHSRDERIPIDEFDRGVERMTRLVAAWAQGPQAVPAETQGPTSGSAAASSGHSMR